MGDFFMAQLDQVINRVFGPAGVINGNTGNIQVIHIIINYHAGNAFSQTIFQLRAVTDNIRKDHSANPAQSQRSPRIGQMQKQIQL